MVSKKRKRTVNPMHLAEGSCADEGAYLYPSGYNSPVSMEPSIHHGELTCGSTGSSNHAIRTAVSMVANEASILRKLDDVIVATVGSLEPHHETSSTLGRGVIANCTDRLECCTAPCTSSALQVSCAGPPSLSSFVCRA